VPFPAPREGIGNRLTGSVPLVVRTSRSHRAKRLREGSVSHPSMAIRKVRMIWSRASVSTELVVVCADRPRT
jgi:hypothetical protein